MREWWNSTKLSDRMNFDHLIRRQIKKVMHQLSQRLQSPNVVVIHARVKLYHSTIPIFSQYNIFYNYEKFFNLRFFLFSIVAKEVNQIRNNAVCAVAALFSCFAVGKEVVVNLIDCNPWFTSQHNNSMRRFGLRPTPL